MADAVLEYASTATISTWRYEVTSGVSVSGDADRSRTRKVLPALQARPASNLQDSIVRSEDDHRAGFADTTSLRAGGRRTKPSAPNRLAFTTGAHPRSVDQPECARRVHT